VRQPTLHPIFETHRVSVFRQMLSAPASSEQLPLLGELMQQSHESYSRCKLGSPGTDRFVCLKCSQRVNAHALACLCMHVCACVCVLACAYQRAHEQEGKRCCTYVLGWSACVYTTSIKKLISCVFYSGLAALRAIVYKYI